MAEIVPGRFSPEDFCHHRVSAAFLATSLKGIASLPSLIASPDAPGRFASHHI
jgi:hypothetical protein